MRTAVVVDVELEIVPELLDFLEVSRLLRRDGHLECIVLQVAESLRLIAVVVGEKDLLHPVNAEGRELLQDVPGPEADQERGAPVAQHIDVAGILVDGQVLAQVLHGPGWAEVALVSACGVRGEGWKRPRGKIAARLGERDE